MPRRVERVVGQNDVTGLVALEAFDGRGHAHRQHVGDADVARVAEDLALRRDQGAVEVPRLLDEGREGGAMDDVAHFLHDAGEAVVQNLEEDLVDRHGCASPSRFPYSSDVTV